jgi:cytochrome b involved in lipid metabolism
MKLQSIITTAVAIIIGIVILKFIPGNANSTVSALIVDPSRCLITVSGKQYDLTQFRTMHSGGDIFVCGTDMTQVYISQHGSNMSKLSRYLVK